MGSDLCQHFGTAYRSEGVAHVHLQQDFVRLRILYLRAHFLRGYFGCIRNLHSNLLWLQMIGDSCNDGIHQQLAGQPPKGVPHCNWAAG